jgi:glucan phosphoethanolaminetransferase (alkaline phosphatase superfamily)
MSNKVKAVKRTAVVFAIIISVLLLLVGFFAEASAQFVAWTIIIGIIASYFWLVYSVILIQMNYNDSIKDKEVE